MKDDKCVHLSGFQFKTPSQGQSYLKLLCYLFQGFCCQFLWNSDLCWHSFLLLKFSNILLLLTRGSVCITLAVLNCITRLASYSQRSPCLCLLSIEIKRCAPPHLAHYSSSKSLPEPKYFSTAVLFHACVSFLSVFWQFPPPAPGYGFAGCRVLYREVKEMMGLWMMLCYLQRYTFAATSQGRNNTLIQAKCTLSDSF